MYYGKPSKARFYGSCHRPHTRATFCSPTKSKRDSHKISCSATPIAGYSASLTRNNQHNVVFRTLIGGKPSRTKNKQEQANRLIFDFKLKELLGIRLLGKIVFSPSFSFYLKYDRNRIISVVNTIFHLFTRKLILLKVVLKDEHIKLSLIIIKFRISYQLLYSAIVFFFCYIYFSDFKK